jgi:hypothetical protein
MSKLGARKMHKLEEQFTRAFVAANQEALTDAAQEAYAKHGRGHLVVVAVGADDCAAPEGACYYVNEELNDTLPDPDERLERMVREYNPATHSVVVVHIGRWYTVCLVQNVSWLQVHGLAA